MRAAALILAALLACGGCAAPPECEPDTHETWEAFCGGDFGYAADEFEPGEQAAMHAAADRWNAFTGATLVQLRPGRGTCQIEAGTLAEGKTGWYEFSTGTIMIDRAKVTVLESTTMHEIGHALGFQHAHEGGIMCSTSRDDFNESDRTQCERLGLCKN